MPMVGSGSVVDGEFLQLRGCVEEVLPQRCHGLPPQLFVFVLQKHFDQSLADFGLVDFAVHSRRVSDQTAHDAADAVLHHVVQFSILQLIHEQL